MKVHKTKAVVQDKKDVDYVWTCDYCGKEFDTKKKSDLHELTCPKNPKNNEIIFKIKKPDGNTVFGLAFVLFILYFLVYFIADSYAKSNDLPTRDLLQPHRWFESRPTPTATPIPTPTSIPTPTAIPTATPRPKIVCPVHANCKGQEFTLKSGKCSDYTCCQIGNQYIVATVSDCNTAQAAINSFVPNVPLPAFKPNIVPTAVKLPTIQPYEKPVIPNLAPFHPGGVYTISNEQCLSDCPGTVDMLLTAFRNECRANGALNGSECINTLNSRDSLINQCRAECK